MADPTYEQLLEENLALREVNTRLKERSERLEAKLDLLIRRVFGKSSEKLSANQLDLFLEKPEEPSLGKEGASSLEEAEPLKGNRGKAVSRGRVTWPENLPVVEEVVDPQEVAKSPEDWRLIGAEVSEQLDYEPGRFFRRRVVRRKYVERGNTEAVPVIAPLAPMLQERVWLHRVCWPPLSWVNTSTTYPFTGRNRSSPNVMGSKSRARTWFAGWNWLPTG